MIGDRLGGWILEAEIGRGGMGTVYRARRESPSEDGPTEAALKVLAAELAVEVGFQQRFQREIDILRQLEHPHVVRFFDSGATDNRYWYAMELIIGESYEDLRDGRGRIAWRQALDMAWQIAPALKHAHDRGVIHRDIKPSNLLRDGDGFVKLTDFGIASLFASPHLTVTGGVIGTPEYLSPEQAAGKPVTKRSDLYSLGVVLYTLVTGRNPFEGDAVELLHKHQYGQVERPSRWVPELHHDFEKIILGLLEKDPAKRPGDANVLFKQLDRLRKKLARQTQVKAEVGSGVGETSGREGPATIMSRLMRQELDEMNRPGPIRRVVEQPLVLVLLFVLCAGAIAWTFWPRSAESLYGSGAALMASKNPDDWDKAWARYFTPLEEKYPNHPYQDELAAFKQQVEDHNAEQKAEGQARWVRKLSEGQWFFEKGMRLRDQGQEDAARKTWQWLVEAFRNVPAEKPWVRRAEQELERGDLPKPARSWRSLQEALKRAKALQEEGKNGEATAVHAALKELYRDDPAALAVIRKE